MPPKKAENKPSKKNEAKKKDKIIEDKTFGLKNKKGAKQQKFIKTVVTQVKHDPRKKAEDVTKTKAKEDKKKELDELNMLFKPVQTIAKGVDPKSVLCAFFKQGTCGKGDKCKFSHDLKVFRKAEKRNMYEDTREQDKMEDWDEQKLEEVISKKHGESNKTKQTTTIICKYFLEAVENGKYGWFWSCPNGGQNCMYRHALPPGFELKKDKDKGEKTETISIEELVERERAALGSNTTRVTLETFLKWKEKKKSEKLKALKDTQSKKNQISHREKYWGGREMFEFNPDLVRGDDDEAAEGELERERDEDDEREEQESKMKIKDVNLDMFVPIDVDDSASSRLTKRDISSRTCNGDANEGEDGKMDEAGALPPTTDGAGDTASDAAIAMAIAATKSGGGETNIEIDEDLFDGEDLDLVEEDLETLDLED